MPLDSGSVTDWMQNNTENVLEAHGKVSILIDGLSALCYNSR